VADYRENEGVYREIEQILWDARSYEASDISKHCQLLASKDFPPSDGVPRGKEGVHGGLQGEAIYGSQTPSYHRQL
jgi:hypothetical protein